MKSTLAPYINAYLPGFITSFFIFLSYMLGKTRQLLVFLAEWIRDDDILPEEEVSDISHTSSAKEKDTEDNNNDTGAGVFDKTSAPRKTGPVSSGSSSSVPIPANARPRTRVYVGPEEQQPKPVIRQGQSPKMSYKMYLFVAFLLYHFVSVMILASKESGSLEKIKTDAADALKKCVDTKKEPRCGTEKDAYQNAANTATIFNSILGGLQHYSPIGGMFTVGPAIKTALGVHSFGDFIRISLVLFTPLCFAFALAYVAWLVMQPSKIKKRQ